MAKVVKVGKEPKMMMKAESKMAKGGKVPKMPKMAKGGKMGGKAC